MNRAIRVRLLGAVVGLSIAATASGCCSAAAGGATQAGPTVAPTQNGAPGGGSPTASSAGRWCGDITQAGVPPYPMVMVLAGEQPMSGTCGSTEYASIPCGGRLTCIAPADGAEGVPRYRENLTSGHDRCIEGGVISIQVQGDTMLWEYRRPDGALDATATLRRCG